MKVLWLGTSDMPPRMVPYRSLALGGYGLQATWRMAYYIGAGRRWVRLCSCVRARAATHESVRAPHVEPSPSTTIHRPRIAITWAGTGSGDPIPFPAALARMLSIHIQCPQDHSPNRVGLLGHSSARLPAIADLLGGPVRGLHVAYQQSVLSWRHPPHRHRFAAKHLRHKVTNDIIPR